MTRSSRIRVLHVVGGMNRAGTESWLMNVYRTIDRSKFEFHFLVFTSSPSPFEQEILELGGQIIRTVSPLKVFEFSRDFHRIVRENGGYDVVHSHIHFMSGWILCLAKVAGVPSRIAHSHLDTSRLPQRQFSLRNCYQGISRLVIHWVSTMRLAVSQLAAESLFGDDWRQDPGCRILYCGVDLSRFHALPDEVDARSTLGIDPGAFVVGHVGRFDRQKNHDFIVSIASLVAASESQVEFLLIGDGELRQSVQSSVRKRYLNDHFEFAGVRSDVPRLMMEVMDMFILPSHYEGLPIVGVEAQAAGLECVFSTHITREVGVVPELVSFVPIDDPALWAQVILDKYANKERACSRQSPCTLLEDGDFDVRTSARALASIYASDLSALYR